MIQALLDAEADRLCNAQRSSAALRQQTFETAIIERYRRRGSSVEEALIGIVHRSRTSPRPCGAGGSLRRRCRILTRGFLGRLRRGAIGRSRASIGMSIPVRFARVAVGGDRGQQRGLSGES